MTATDGADAALTTGRVPRLRRIAPPITIRLPDPPAPPTKVPRAPLWRALLVGLLPATLPPLGLAVATLVMGQQSQLVVTSVVMVAAMGLGMLMTTLISRRDEDTRQATAAAEYSQRSEDHRAALDAIEARCAEHAQLRRDDLLLSHPATSSLVSPGAAASPLWARLPGDDDFLALRLGSGSVVSGITFEPAGSADAAASAIQRGHEHISGAPVVWPARDLALTGLIGLAQAVTSLLDSVLAQAAAGHSPADLRILVLSRDEELLHWVKWLPHAMAGTAGGTLVARSPRGAAAALRALADLEAAQTSPAALIILDRRTWPDVFDRYGQALRRPGRSLLVIGSNLGDLPVDCQAVIEVVGGQGVMRRRVDAEPPVAFQPDVVERPETLTFALRLGPLAASVSSLLEPAPTSVRSVDVLGPASLTSDGVAASWRASRSEFRLRAPIGIGSGGRIVEVDLRADGPHGLIAGTTGSGKSELLQTLIASLAAKIPPDLLNFLLIDYKGGGAFGDLERLPHVVGMVSDLEEGLARRAIISLRAELRRREHLFANAGLEQADIRVYQSQPRSTPLANLVIIADEFHRLVSEQPDFIDQLVRIATQGRSLGVHLLLATQKPSGVVSEHIRANTNLRICLRVTDDADSRDVLGIADAARIPREVPGRALIKIGADHPIPVQTARTSGLIEPPGQEGPVTASWFVRPVRRAVRSGGVTAWPVLPTVGMAASSDETSTVKLVDGRQALIEAIGHASRAGGIPVQVPPWLPPLPKEVALELPDQVTRWTHEVRPPVAVVGLLDEPELQLQRPFEVDLSSGHLLVAGGPNSGKTSALIALAQSFARRLSPTELHIYGFDFGGTGLEPLRQLPHCGGVARQYDQLSTNWLLRALSEIVATRSAEQPTATPGAIVLVLIDNLVALSSALQGLEDPGVMDDLLEVMDAGRSVGVVFAVSAERPEAIRSGILATMTTRLVLPLTDDASYGALGLWRPKTALEPIPGRAVVADGTGHEVQLASPAPWASVLAGLPAQPGPGSGGPVLITTLPLQIRQSEVRFGAAPTDLALVLGLQDGTEPVLRFPIDEHLLVLGPRGTGKSNALAVALHEALRVEGSALVLCGRGSPSLGRAAAEWPSRVRFVAPANIGTALSELHQWVAEAKVRWQEAPGGAPTQTLILDDADAMDFPVAVSDLLQMLVLRGPDIGIRLVVSANTLALRAQYRNDWLRALLGLRRGVLLGPQTPEDFDFFGVRGRPQKMSKGRGYLCGDGSKRLVQVALLDEYSAVADLRP